MVYYIILLGSNYLKNDHVDEYYDLSTSNSFI